MGTVKSSTWVCNSHICVSPTICCAVWGVSMQSAISGGSRILKRGVPVCTWSLYLVKCNKVHKACLLGGSIWRHAPQRKIDFRPYEIISGAILGWNSKSWTTYRLVNWAFKHLQSLKVWLCFTLQRLQSSCKPQKKKKILTTRKRSHTDSILSSMRREHCIQQLWLLYRKSV